MRKWKNILAVVLVSAAGIIALVEYLSAQPRATLEDELLAAAALLPDFEQVYNDPEAWEKIRRSAPYNHLASLGKAGFRLALRRLREEPEDPTKIMGFGKALLYYDHKELHVEQIASLIVARSDYARIFGIWLLGTIPQTVRYPDVLDALLKKADETDWTVRGQLARALARLSWGPSDRTYAALVNDPHPEVERAACEWAEVIKFPDRFPETAKALANKALSGKDPELRGEALYSLQKMGGHGFRITARLLPDEACARLVRDPDVNISRLACVIPYYMTEPASYPRTLEAMIFKVGEMSDEQSRASIAKALVFFAIKGAPLTPKAVEGARVLERSKDPLLAKAGRDLLNLVKAGKPPASRPARPGPPGDR